MGWSCSKLPLAFRVGKWPAALLAYPVAAPSRRTAGRTGGSRTANVRLLCLSPLLPAALLHACMQKTRVPSPFFSISVLNALVRVPESHPESRIENTIRSTKQ